MSKFNVGDILVALEDSGHYYYSFKKGEEYEVVSTGRDSVSTISLIGGYENGWIDEKFRLANDNIVSKPAHYQHPSGIEVIDITAHESFLRGNIIKYVMRAPYKGEELTDLKKAAEYLRREIERVDKEG